MTEINNQDQTQNEIHYQTIAEFLQSTPPNQFASISDLAICQNVHQSPMKRPDIKLYCANDSCRGDRFFRWFQNERESLGEDGHTYFYVTYLCSNCQQTTKVYSLAAKVYEYGEPQGECYKLGEYPPYGPHVPSKLIELIGPDRDLFLQGRRCESQGLGIGAFTYYRRVVENQKNRILEKNHQSIREDRSTPRQNQYLREAMKETQFSTALEMAKEVMPESLLIDGHNPILLLHRALSRGVHELSDEECLDFARSVRMVLSELSGRLSVILKDEAELQEALSTLMDKKNR